MNVSQAAMPKDFDDWAVALREVLLEKYPHYACLLPEHGVPAMPGLLGPPQPHEDDGRAVWALYSTQLSAFSKKGATLAEQRPQVFNLFKSACGPSMIAALELDPAYVVANTTPFDPLALLTMIKVVCTTGVPHDEDAAGLLVKRQIKVAEAYHGAKQLPTETVSDYKKKVVSALVVSTSLSNVAPSEPIQAQTFINGLLPSFSTLKSDIANGRKTRPLTLASAYRAALSFEPDVQEPAARMNTYAVDTRDERERHPLRERAAAAINTAALRGGRGNVMRPGPPRTPRGPPPPPRRSPDARSSTPPPRGRAGPGPDARCSTPGCQSPRHWAAHCPIALRQRAAELEVQEQQQERANVTFEETHTCRVVATDALASGDMPCYDTDDDLPHLTDLDSDSEDEAAPPARDEDLPELTPLSDSDDDEDTRPPRSLPRGNRRFESFEDRLGLGPGFHRTQRSEAYAAGSSMRDTEVGLDSMSSKGIFVNEALLHGVHESDVRISMGGILAGGRRIVTGRVGESAFGRVYVSPEASVNVLSLAEMEVKAHSLHMVGGAFELQMTPGGRVYVFRPRGQNRLYVCDLAAGGEEEELACVGAGEASGAAERGPAVPTVAGNRARYTKRELKSADVAEGLLGAMKGVPPAVIIRMLNEGNLVGTSVVPGDIARTVAINGPPLAGLKGRSTAQPHPIVLHEDVPPIVRIKQEFHSDLFFVAGIVFIVNVMVPMRYIFVDRILSKSAPDVWKGTLAHLRAAKGRGIEITSLRCDREAAVLALAGELSALGVTLNNTAEGGTVPIAERGIRRIKEMLRCTLNTLPFEVAAGAILVGAVTHVVGVINMVPSSTSELRISPREQFTGRKVVVGRDLPMPFGQYCQCSHGKTSNNMKPRSDGCIFLHPSGNLEGSKVVFNISTGGVTVRQHCTPLPMTDDVIGRLNDIANGSIAAGALGARSDEEEQGPGDSDWDEGVVAGSSEAEPGALPLLVDPVEQEYVPTNPEGVVDDGVVPGEDGPGRGRYQLRGRDVPRRWTALPQAQEEASDPEEPVREYGLHLSVNEGIKKLGRPAYKAIVKEMIQLHGKAVWKGVNTKKLSVQERAKIISSSMFLKEKYTASGEFEKVKGRVVAGGDQQDRPLHAEETSAPTMGTSSLFILMALAAREGSAVATADVPGAYLEADMPETGKPVYMRLNRFLAAIQVAIDPSYKDFVREDGTVVVVLKKALYGCIESALLWYKTLRAVLEALGFAANDRDPCVFRRTQGGHVFTLGVYVDDLVMIGHSEEAIDDVLAALGETFADLSVHRGRTLNYVGMTMDFSQAKVCRVTMANFVGELLAECEDIDGVAGTPATATLFDTAEHGVALPEGQRKRFHSLVAKLLYLGKRCRPDMLTVVAFLATRVLAATDGDWRKLVRALHYLRNTEAMGICLEVGDKVEVMAYVDASFAPHSDMRSHSGVVISLGRGPVYASSSRQRLTTKSSTEAELVALSDAMGQVIWTRDFLLALGYAVGPARVAQDNQATMALVRNGRSNSARTRHISIRYFFVSDRVTGGEVALYYLPTGEMIADMLTKPLTGAAFVAAREELLNWLCDLGEEM